MTKQSNAFNSAKVTEIIYSDTNNVTTLLLALSDFILNIFNICITGVILWKNDTFLTYILSVMYIILALWGYKHSQMLRNINVKLRHETDIHFKMSRDIIKNVKYICLSNSIQTFLNNYENNLEHVKEETIKRDQKAWILGFISSLLGYSWILIFLIYSVFQMQFNKLVVTKFILFLSYSRIYTTGITSLFNDYSGLQQIFVSVERVIQLLLSKKEEHLEKRDKTFPLKLNTIEICNLEFSYGEKKIISDLSRKFTKKIILVTGKNGQGKTTLLNLFAGVLVPTKGDIFYNGISVKKISYDSLYDLLSYACQGDIVFDMSIRENILSFKGHESITEECLYEICEKIGVLKDILALKEQFDTPISEIRDFSYGQKKKILLARACLKPSEVILFDEPLDGLDLQSQKLFLNLICELSTKKYIIISTHKPDYFVCNKETIIL